MRRVVGFACFMIAAGLILSMFLPGLVWDIFRELHMDAVGQAVFFQQSHQSVFHIDCRHSDDTETLHSNRSCIFRNHFR
jgi:hypothetical protein